MFLNEELGRLLRFLQIYRFFWAIFLSRWLVCEVGLITQTSFLSWTPYLFWKLLPRPQKQIFEKPEVWGEFRLSNGWTNSVFEACELLLQWKPIQNGGMEPEWLQTWILQEFSSNLWHIGNDFGVTAYLAARFFICRWTIVVSAPSHICYLKNPTRTVKLQM